MTKNEIIQKRHPFFNEDISMKDIEINAEVVKELMNDYLIDQLKGLVEDLKQVHSEYIIDRINDEIYSLEHGC
jgi:hypothetical protein